jgi:hypothetical protein
MSMNMSIWDGLECAGLAQSIAFSDPTFMKLVEKRFQEQVKRKKG